MTLFLKPRIVQLHPPKTGGCTLHEFFLHQNSRKSNGPDKSHRHSTYEELKALIPDWKRYHKVMTCRDPWSRCLSAYNYFQLWSQREFLDALNHVWESHPYGHMGAFRHQRDWWGEDVEVISRLDEYLPPGTERKNVTAPDKIKVTFDEAYSSQRVVDAVADYYYDDIQLFGFSFPGK